MTETYDRLESLLEYLKSSNSPLWEATLVRLMAGCRSLSETEALTATLAPVMRRRLGLPRRLPDTTARDALCRVSLDGLLRRRVSPARKQLLTLAHVAGELL